HDFQLEVGLCELLPDERVLARAPTVVFDGVRTRDQGREVALENDLNSRSKIGTLIHQSGDCGGPTLVDLAEHLRDWHADIREEHFVKARVPGHLPQGARCYAFAEHVHQQAGDTFVFWRL